MVKQYSEKIRTQCHKFFFRIFFRYESQWGFENCLRVTKFRRIILTIF